MREWGNERKVVLVALLRVFISVTGKRGISPTWDFLKRMEPASQNCVLEYWTGRSTYQLAFVPTEWWLTIVWTNFSCTYLYAEWLPPKSHFIRDSPEKRANCAVSWWENILDNLIWNLSQTLCKSVGEHRGSRQRRWGNKDSYTVTLFLWRL